MRRVLGYWIHWVKWSIILLDTQPDVFDKCYKNESRLPSNDMSIISL